uniref:Acetyl-coenzyme A synthetase n=1 Tax=Bicosoecida sp. CB-2014 TaxID=1486930 RepID=A0A7S1C8B5_9STRA
MYYESIHDSDAFWGRMALENITWFRDFDRVSQGSFEVGDIAWFTGGRLNVSYNCIDRHLEDRGDKTAIIWEDDEGNTEHISYKKLLQEVSRVANVLKDQGVRKGDTVAVYLPMIPQLAYVMLACARIGAPHSVVFAGFSADSLRDRIVDGHSKWVVCSDEGLRGGKTIPLKQTVDDACTGAAAGIVQKVFMFKRTGAAVNVVAGRDVWMEPEMAKARPYCPAVPLDSEDMLFLLYTSGSTGKPKGVAHSQAGYLLYTMLTHRYVFDIREDDVYACVADCGWITGHSYIVYGPLANGATTLMFESTPLYPNASRYWDLVQRNKVTQFYTAPTAIRALMRHGTEPVEGYDLSSLRVLGTVGEPINPEAWRWYHKHIGKGKCKIVDTYWQTETGGIMLTPLPEATPTKPGSATLPFFGIQPVIRDKDSGEVLTGNGVQGVLCIGKPWPSLARTVYGDHERYLKVYMTAYAGNYFTGDGAIRDKDGYYWITGRVDDVLNVSGHRLGSAEIESALVAHEFVAEAAVIGFPHDVKGEGLCCYVTLVKTAADSAETIKALKQQVRKVIGPFATPDYIIITPALPKTRSGKIMRRVLRKIIARETDSLGDITTLADSSVIEGLIKKVNSVLDA